MLSQSQILPVTIRPYTPDKTGSKKTLAWKPEVRFPAVTDILPEGNRFMRSIFVSFLELLGCVVVLNLNALPLLAQGEFGNPENASVKGAVLPFYDHMQGSSTLTGVLRAEAVFVDYQKQGFFKIGAIPMLVADGVRLEFPKTSSVSSVLQRIHSAWEGSGGKGLGEMRKAIFTSPEDPNWRLEANRIRFGSEGSWQLNGVEVHQGTNIIKTARAKLQVLGPQAGRLSVAKDRTVQSMQFFTALPTSNQKKKKP